MSESNIYMISTKKKYTAQDKQKMIEITKKQKSLHDDVTVL